MWLNLLKISDLLLLNLTWPPARSAGRISLTATWSLPRSLKVNMIIMLERIWLYSALFIQASLDLNDTPSLLGDEEEEWQWFYRGRNGWRRFEERDNEKLEENFSLWQQMFETMILETCMSSASKLWSSFRMGSPTGIGRSRETPGAATVKDDI